MSLLIAIGGLAFLVLIHEAGHFAVALAVGMRPRKFYVFFPPPLVRTVRNGIEYGIGTIPLGGYVKIPGMHRPAARDLDSALGRAMQEAPWLAHSEAPVRDALERDDHDAARAALPALRAAVERAGLSEAAGKSADRGLTDVDDALSGDAYWRAPAWKRIAVIAAGPAANLVFCVAMLAVVFSLGVVAGATRAVEEVLPATPAAAAGLRQGDIVADVRNLEVEGLADFYRKIWASGPAGNEIPIRIIRDDRDMWLRIKSADRDSFLKKPVLQ